MNTDLTVDFAVHFQTGRRSRKELHPGDATPPPVGRIPRISRLMALAIRLDQMLRDGVVANQAELARLGHVTRARMTQILNLLNLAPDIQEALLFLPSIPQGREPPWEHLLRKLTGQLDWHQQRRMWAEMRNQLIRG